MDDGVMEDGCMVKENGNMSKLGNPLVSMVVGV
jgi:hypothetical protein